MTEISSAARSELAPTGKLRIGINFGNFLLTAKDPATGEPAEPGPLAVTVVAPHAAEAEAHATALAISSPADARAHVAANPRIAALVVPHVGAPFELGALPLAQTRVLVRVAS